MTSPKTRRARENTGLTWAAVGRRASRLGWFAAGIIFGLFFTQVFVRLLPGPHVGVQVSGVRVLSGKDAGCINYLVVLRADKPIEHAYLKIQFLNKITGYKLGLPLETHSATAGRMRMQAWELGRNSRGECDVQQAAVNDDTNMVSSAAGNMLRVSISRLSPESKVVGVVATPEYRSSVNPPEKYYEGSYEYSILGQTVRRPIKFTDRGVTDAK